MKNTLLKHDIKGFAFAAGNCVNAVSCRFFKFEAKGKAEKFRAATQ